MRYLWLLLAALPACTFSPDLGDGTLACGIDRSCPPGYACGEDARCRRPTSVGADAGAADLSEPAADAAVAPDLSCAGSAKGHGGDACKGG